MRLCGSSPGPDDSQAMTGPNPPGSRDLTEVPPGSARTRWICLAILLVLAFGTRLYQLDVLPYGHNNDETGLTYEGYLLLQEPGLPVFVSQAREPTLPYLYGLLVKLFGFSNGVIRLPSALFGVIGCLSLCLLIFRFMPDYWAFCIGAVVITYGPYVALDRLALRTSVCTANGWEL